MSKKPIPKHVSPAQSDPVTRLRMDLELSFVRISGESSFGARDAVKQIDELIALRIKEALDARR